MYMLGLSRAQPCALLAQLAARAHAVRPAGCAQGGALARPGAPRPRARAAAAAAAGSPGSDVVLIPWECETETCDREAEEEMAKLVAQFKAADKDGNGLIGREELRSVLERVAGGEEEVAEVSGSGSEERGTHRRALP